VLDAAVQIDTGMNRSGLTHAETSTLAAEAKQRLAGIKLALVMSHLACSDDPKSAMNLAQLERFRAILAMLPQAPASLAASGGISLGRDYSFDMVRPGIALYGGNPQPALPNPYRVVASLRCRVLQIRHVDSGETVGYGATFTAGRPLKLATVALGYADGLARALGTRGQGALGDVRMPFAGRISMDLAVLDASAVPDGACQRGAEVEFFGDIISLEEVANAAGTINYEILTGVTPRVPRAYVEG
jgi:alanine racemase